MMKKKNKIGNRLNDSDINGVTGGVWVTLSGEKLGKMPTCVGGTRDKMIADAKARAEISEKSRYDQEVARINAEFDLAKRNLVTDWNTRTVE